MLTINMRILLFILIILACAVPLQADNSLENGDFSNGKDGWHGDGETPDEYAQDNPSAASDPLTSKGLIIQLKPHRWTKITQEFKGDKGTYYSLAVTYKVSPDTTLSNKADDYTNAGNGFDFEGSEIWVPQSIESGRFWWTVHDLDDDGGYQETCSPKLGSSEPQTIQDHGRTMTPFTRKMIFIAFPPGNGIVVLLNVSVTSS